MATSTLNREFIEAVAAEMSHGIHAALACWMGKIERVMENNTFTTLGRLQAVKEIIAEYKNVIGQSQLDCRRSEVAH
ncbi:MAG TPA: hypothetical protein VFJ47_11445 [Terriglobales bacterium]|nr:hypothetical protein [Terriglobales bacterium]